jgi:hypothetical protein
MIAPARGAGRGRCTAVSYLMNIAAGAEAGVDVDTVQGVFLAIAPVVGTARVASAGGKIVRALGLAVDVSEADIEVDDD